MAYSGKEADVRRARDEFVRRQVEHQQKSGVAVPDVRKAERHAEDVARRVDRKHSDGK